MGLVLAASAGVLWLFALQAKPEGQGFDITSRYFIYLTPIGVIAVTIISRSLFKSLSRFSLIQWPMVGLIGLLLLQHFLKIVPGAIHSVMRG